MRSKDAQKQLARTFRPFRGQLEDLLDFSPRLNRLAVAAQTWLKFPNNLTPLKVGYDVITGLYLMCDCTEMVYETNKKTYFEDHALVFSILLLCFCFVYLHSQLRQSVFPLISTT